ncbi:MAG: TFIIB-type zinc ribbon-containing protein, partial [Cellulomonadaceae bacterium]
MSHVDPFHPQPGQPAPPAPDAPPAPVPAAGPPETSGPRIVRTDAGAKDGLAKCPRCGATEISLNVATGGLRCGYCRHEWQGQSVVEAFDLGGDIGALRGMVAGSGTADIAASVEEVLTFRCSACGAEVVIDTGSSTQARCHWCRNKLSMNQQVPNGAVPDMILPFKITKDDAVQRISDFVGKRKFYAHPRFKREFAPENVMGVYMPYMVVDVNARAALSGQGEHQTRSYTVKRGDKEQRLYDADLYDVRRSFDLHVDDLTMESSSERANHSPSRNTNNIINTIMPFDVANAVRYDSNYLAGFTSERRDSNIDQLLPLAAAQ